MTFNSNSMAGLINGLPGLLGALQPLNAPLDPAELARRIQRRNLSQAMLGAAARLLAAHPNRYRPLALNMGTGAPPRTHAHTAGGERSHESAGETRRLGALGGAASIQAGEGENVRREPRRRDLAHRSGRRVQEPAHRGPSPGARLRRFSGTVSRRLAHPAVLPGGWELYGFEAGGSPVYSGPGGELRIYQ